MPNQDGVYYKRLVRYVHLNPVEAKLVKRPEHFKWSSYKAYLEQDQYVWLQTDRLLGKFGETREKAIEKFIEYTHRKLEADLDLDVISNAFRKGAFGCQEFVEGIENLKDKNKETDRQIDWSFSDLTLNICKHFDVTIEEMASQNKSPSIVNARSVFAFMTRKLKKWPLEDLAVFLNKNSGTLSRLATKAERLSELIIFCEKNNFQIKD